MIRNRSYLTIGGTLFCAAGIGYFMQRDIPEDYSRIIKHPSGLQQNVLAPSSPGADDDYVALNMRAITLTSALPGLPLPTRVSKPALEHAQDHHSLTREIALPALPADRETPNPGCNVTAAASPAPVARVALSVEAPCYPHQRVTIHHSGLFFSELTDGDGTLDVSIPAMAEQAVFVIEFSNGAGAVTRTEVSELMDYERVAIQWGGQTELTFNTREIDEKRAAADTTHDIVRLGDESGLSAQYAKILTLPRPATGQTSDLALRLEAEVTRDNCNRDINAQSLALTGNGGLRTRDLRLSMPSCDATGEFLVLNNLIEDLKIASN